jgi:hypothetical protein
VVAAKVKRRKWVPGNLYTVIWDDHGAELGVGPEGSSKRNLVVSRGICGASRGRYLFLWYGNPLDESNLEGNVDRYRIIKSQIVAVYDWGPERAGELIND